MPITTLNAKRLTTKAIKALKYFSLFTFHFSLILVLSGCSAIGFQKYAALQVTSTPEASIFLDDKHLGKTPFYSDRLDAGTHTLKITASDASYSTKIDLKDQILTVVDRELANNPLAQSGEVLTLTANLEGIMIVSLPDSVDVTLDGKYQGKTPLQIARVSSGEHKVLLTKVGYVDREFLIKTSGNKQVVAEVTLSTQMTRAPTAEKEASQSAKVTIGKSPQGVVRVLKSPSVFSQEIGTAKIGEQYELRKEQDNWLMINFAGKQGWILAESAKEVK